MQNKQITFAALNSHFLNSNNRINAEYLNDNLIMHVDNTRSIYDAITSTRRKAESVTWEAFMSLATEIIKEDDYPHNQSMSAASEHLKNWLNTYGEGYTTISAAVEHVREERNEYKQYQPIAAAEQEQPSISATEEQPENIAA